MNRGYDYEERLGPEASGRTALDYLAGRYRHSSREAWRRRIASGRVLVDGSPVDPDTPLHPGDSLVWRRPPWAEPEAPLGFAILHRDEDLLAVAKPPGLPTMPAGGYLENTLSALVRRVHPEARPLHRLDRGTSGLVLFARSARGRTRMAAAWRCGEVRRVYLGLVRGRPDRDRFVVRRPIGRIAWSGPGAIAACSPDGKPARTAVRVLERRQDLALVRVTIATGRTHQIRIHLAAAGCPLAGEPLYGAGGLPRTGPGAGRATGRLPRPGDSGYLLHAWRIEFPHPAGGAPVSLSCPPPPILRARAGLQ